MGTARLHRKKHNFSVIDNSGAEDVLLSYRSRGLLWYLLTKPDGWQIRMTDLVAKSPDGKDAVKTAVKELESRGYVVRWRDRAANGLIEWNAEVFECLEDAEEWKQSNPDKVEKASLVGRSQKKDASIPCSTIDGLSMYGLSVDGSSGDGSTIDGKAIDIVNNNLVNTNIREREEKAKSLTHFGSDEPEKQPTEPETIQPWQVSESCTPKTPPPSPPPRRVDPSHPAARMESRLQAGNDPIAQFHPNLLGSGFEGVWVGPGRTDFEPELIKAVQEHKKKYNLPCEVADAKQYISNCIFHMKWNDLELRLGEVKAQRSQAQEETISDNWYEKPSVVEIWQEYVRLHQAVGVTMQALPGPHFQYIFTDPRKGITNERDRFCKVTAARRIRTLKQKLAERSFQQSA